MSEAKKMVDQARKGEKLSSKAGSLMELINSRQTDELIIAFCGALGSGTSVVAKRFEANLAGKKYDTKYIKVSTLIVDSFPEDKRIENLGSMAKAKKIETLQDLGNELRDEYGTDVLAQKIVSSIAIDRREETKESKEENKRNRRHVTFIDSLKHPAEYELLKAVYGNMFYMVGVLCPEQIRTNRLVNEDGFGKEDAVILTQRDKNEGLKYGQKLVKTIQHADFFIRNAKGNAGALDNPIDRYLNLMLGKRDITPTLDEYAMNAAHSASLRSGCMSRQVGAAILSAEGDLISTGRNDVPRGGGGLYGPEDGEDDFRCVMKANGTCQSNDKKNEIIGEIEGVFKSELMKVCKKVDGLVELLKKENMDVDGIVEMLRKKAADIPQLEGLIEFSRAVHAEMDAITTAARMSTVSLRGGSLYCTTFPCHHCARHIVSSGISKVYYIEPYEKSLAFDLHSDSIEIDASDKLQDISKLRIIPFEGVAPKQFVNMFEIGNRKKNGKRIDVDLSVAKPVLQKFLFNSLDFEKVVATYHGEQMAAKK
ncbi:MULTISPECIES: anti-phage dCTP deaminase [unclassified Pseudodesulfovibrio]|uniref:anti-phage dCTP deaminase n=1 Tax=unclassified Pseudodesulfovibrio TaxID=2661612 RepID=UPI0013E2A9D4|nr:MULTISPECIES: anti-phage dCTP deaminase [unclassified Pseudodesulfovibrio]MCJ2165596.1 deaminase [Pseudodesulfovibrio sp. S3-i]